PAGGQWPAASTVYAQFQTKLTGTIVPISAATNRPGKPIHVGGSMAVAPDGKTAYAAGTNTVVPISTASDRITLVNLATNKPGKSIRVCPIIGMIAFTPDGKTAY